jgi:alkanesulfonate monooxygenase SsuD/methylene tetrahydromethanopterin reductase-like flavin-dependent oxidoreductase (luciferase family)
MSIRLGLQLPVQKTYTIGRDVPEVARAAEQIGYDSLWVAERVLVPESPVDGMLGIPGLPWPDLYRGNGDPLVVLGLAAAATERVMRGGIGPGPRLLRGHAHRHRAIRGWA